MTCEELQSDYAAWALGIAGDPERLEIAAHLERKCPVCTAGVREAMETVAAMSGAVKLVEPPRTLRTRVVGLVAPVREQRGWLAAYAPWGVSALLAGALTFMIVAPRPKPLDTAQARLDEAMAILGDPVAKDVSFGPANTRGRVFVSPGKGVVFVAAGLPKLDPHRIFELWVIPAAGNPIPAGTFSSVADSAVYVHAGPVVNAAAFAVTIEPEGGSPQPTSQPFIVAKL